MQDVQLLEQMQQFYIDIVTHHSTLSALFCHRSRDPLTEDDLNV
ncbi:hypothetical protein [Coleofasciculus sp. FACHB-SPT9]|nr:hypothetical protein [Coleofasciculus sp. FACHB-SPT9]